ncbi:hypothetical protein MSG28_005151 [Choristoneura fumiferana]|uniref:Uncharacterized protein n=1 Tax=Choristoneura fumiferana TaxID=7141 RepID=A0ACC0JQQ0_CHOFU|nr:hypothetical protein MSG28_005151 [Choristoneura fumiferana]
MQSSLFDALYLSPWITEYVSQMFNSNSNALTEGLSSTMSSTMRCRYYADTLSVDEEVRGNATVSVKDEARGFHLNNLSYAGPIVMGFGGPPLTHNTRVHGLVPAQRACFVPSNRVEQRCVRRGSALLSISVIENSTPCGGVVPALCSRASFIVVAACVMTFEARDSAAKVTPARPQALPRPVPRRGPARPPGLTSSASTDYRMSCRCRTHFRSRRSSDTALRIPLSTGGSRSRARFGSAPDLRGGGARAVPVTALRRPLRRYALSVDEPPHSAVRY